MLCSNCSRLAFLYSKKPCVRCQSDVFTNLSVLCEKCSSTSVQCSVCLKKINLRPRISGCGCGRK